MLIAALLIKRVLQELPLTLGSSGVPEQLLYIKGHFGVAFDQDKDRVIAPIEA